jgi:putative ABC transport system permease protein
MIAFCLIWVGGLLRHRSGRLLGAALGVALAVSLITSLLGFIDGAARSMTARAVASVPVDWQVQINPGADRAAVADAVRSATPTWVVRDVGYADVASMTSTSGGTVQTTGAGKVLGLPLGAPGLRSRFS